MLLRLYLHFSYDFAVLDCRFEETELCYRAEKSQVRWSPSWLVLELDSGCHCVPEKVRRLWLG